MLSKRDCLKAALNASYHKQWGGVVADYMSPDPETLDADLDLVDAAEHMIASSFRRFPVTRARTFRRPDQQDRRAGSAERPMALTQAPS